MKIILNKLTYIIIYMCACAMAVAQSGINIKKNYPRFDRVRYEYQATTDSVKNGKFVEYHLNKNTKWTGHYTMGKKDSVFTEYFEDGKTIKTLQDHTKGIEKQYYNAKKLAHEVTLVNEKYNGGFKGYYMDGSLESTGLYADGNKTGEWLFYHKNKQLDMKGNFVNGAQQGLWRYYFATGELMTTGNYIEGKRDSTWTVYYKNKQIERQGNYANDLRTGIWTTYFEDGKKLQQGAYYKDKADDKWYAWYNDGIVKDEGEYKNGLSEGVWKGNYPNGKPNYVGNKHNDLKEGVWKYYDQKAGILIKEQEYKLGAPDGYFKTYYALTGKPEQEGYYQKGLKENTWKYYYPFGMLLMYENHKAGKMHGEKVTYFENGKKNSVTGYVNNLQHGKWTYYNDKEEKLYSVTYEFGKKVKETKYNNGNPEEIKYTKDKPKKKKT